MLFFASEPAGLHTMHHVNAALATHGVGCNEVGPGPGVERGRRSHRFQRIQLVVHCVNSSLLFSHLLKIAPKLSVLVGCTNAVQVAGGLSGLPCHGWNSALGRRRCHRNTILHTLPVVVVEAASERAIFEHSG